MSEKEILEAQAEALKDARERIATGVNEATNYNTINELAAQLIAVVQEERAVASLQMDRGYIKAK